MNSVFLEWGLICPQCHFDSGLVITFTGTANLSASGTSDVGNHDWGDDSPIFCECCDHSGEVSGFRPVADSFETVACLWEAFLQGDYPPPPEGVAEERQKVIKLHEACDRAYMFAKTQEYDSCFDWHFVPFFLRMCWHNDWQLPLDWVEQVKGFCDANNVCGS